LRVGHGRRRKYLARVLRDRKRRLNLQAVSTDRQQYPTIILVS